VNISPSIFREYDIRGIVDKELTPDVVETLGRAIGTYFRRRDKKVVALGHDCRLSSPAYAAAMSKGLSRPAATSPTGTVPTPLLYFAIYYKKFEAGVMITGSHNPPEYNGFKMMCGEETIYGETIQEISASSPPAISSAKRRGKGPTTISCPNTRNTSWA